MSSEYPAPQGHAMSRETRPASCSPWHDNLRHMYEAGRSLEDLAYWYTGKNKTTMRRILLKAGTIIRKRGTHHANQA